MQNYIVVGLYMLFLIGIGIVQSRQNKNVSDYFRNGCKASWWMVGASAFMTGISAYTFTGAAGVAFEAGWSVMVIYIGGVASYLIQFLFLAPWFRQLRSITVPEVIQLRFGPATRQFYAWIGVVSQLLMGSLQLYALAIFCSAIFGFPIHSTIIVIGMVVLAYSLIGGSWAVMSNDFLQSLILVPITLLIPILCLVKIGGLDSFFDTIKQQNLTQNFQMFKPSEKLFSGNFTLMWAFAIWTLQLTGNGLNCAAKYFGVKDGKEARKAAIFAAALSAIGAFFWFIPPMAARLLYPDSVMAVNISKPEESAFAVIGMKLLPPGLVGLMVVAMFAATTSSLDTALNRNAAVIVRDIYPALCRLLRMKPIHATKLLRLGQFATFLLGIGIISFASYFARKDGVGVFDIMMDVISILALPLGIPLLACIFIKRTPGWAGLFAIGFAAIFSAMGFWSEELFGQSWSFQKKVFIIMPASLFAYLITLPFWRFSGYDYKKRVAKFFRKMHTPVDFTREVGQSVDISQLRTVGSFAIALGLFITGISLFEDGWKNRLCIFAVAGFSLLVGGGMLLASFRKKRNSQADSLPEPPTGTNLSLEAADRIGE